MFDLMDLSDLSSSLGVDVVANRLSPYVVVSGTSLILQSDDDAETKITSTGVAIPETATFECELEFLDLPIVVDPSFERVSFGLYDVQNKGTAAQFSADELGVSDSHETSLQKQLLGVQQNVPYTLRVVMDKDSGVADYYLTPTADLPTTGHQIFFTTSLLPPPLSFSDSFVLSVVGRSVHPINLRVDTLRLSSSLMYPNRRPVADAQDTTGRVGQSVLLDGSSSYDPEGNTLSFQWAFTSVPSGSSITDADLKPSVRFHLPGDEDESPYFVPDVPGVYALSLVVNDGSLPSTTKTVSVQVSKASMERGYTPDTSPLFSVLSSSWEFIQEKNIVETFWSSLLQVTASDLTALWQKDRGKSIQTIQREVHRKWLDYDTALDLQYETVTTQLESEHSGGSGRISYQEGTDLVATGTDTVTSASSLFQTRGIEVGTKMFLNVHPFTAVVQSIVSDTEIILDKVVPSATGVLFSVGSKRSLYEPSSTLSSVKAGQVIRITEGSNEWVRVVTAARTDIVVFDEDVASSNLLAWEVAPLSVDIGYAIPEKMKAFYGDKAIWEQEVSGEIATLSVNVLGTSGSKYGLFTTSSYLSASALRLLRIQHLQKFPCFLDTTSIPFLQTVLKDAPESDVLIEHRDFSIERGTEISWIVKTSAYTEETVPDTLWAEYTYLSNAQSIYDNFGRLVGLSNDDPVVDVLDFDYLSAVRGLLYCYMMGPSIDNLKTGLQVFCGLPFTESQEEILKIEATYTATLGRITTRSFKDGTLRTYFYKLSLGVAKHPTEDRDIAETDTLPAYTPLSKGVDLIDWIIDATWWKSLSLQEIEKYFTFGVWVDADVADSSLLSSVFASCVTFINKVKPVYTKVVAAIKKRLDDTVDVTDSFSLLLSLLLVTKVCRDSRHGLYGEDYSSGDPMWFFGGGMPYGYGDRLCPEASLLVEGCDLSGGGGAFVYGSVYPFGLSGLTYGGTTPLGDFCAALYDEDQDEAATAPMTTT